MKILFLGDVVGQSGCNAIKKNLQNVIKEENIDFTIVNGENAANDGVGITQNILDEFLSCGVDVVTSGNHIWDHVFMKKSNDLFSTLKKFLENKSLKKDYDCLIVDIHGEITSEKMAIGHFLDGKASLVVGTHTHVPTNDARILSKGTGYMTDAGMCGDYDSVIGMDKNNSIKRFLKEDSIKHFPSKGEASLSGVIVELNKETGLAVKIKSFIKGGVLKKTE